MKKRIIRVELQQTQITIQEKIKRLKIKRMPKMMQQILQNKLKSKRRCKSHQNHKAHPRAQILKVRVALLHKQTEKRNRRIVKVVPDQRATRNRKRITRARLRRYQRKTKDKRTKKTNTNLRKKVNQLRDLRKMINQRREEADPMIMIYK